MSLLFEQLFVLVSCIILFLFFIVIGIPLSILIMYFLDKYVQKINLPKKKRIHIAFGVNIGLFLILGFKLIFSDYLSDGSLRHILTSYDIAIPLNIITNVEYPEMGNRGDDYQQITTHKVLFGFSNKSIRTMDSLCTAFYEDNTSYSVNSRIDKLNTTWTYYDSIYHVYYYDDCEHRINISLDIKNNVIITDYQHF